MAELLIRLENTKWYVLVDVEQEKILSQHNKLQVEADIAAIITTLERFPDPTTDEYAYGKLHELIQASKLTLDEKAYGKDLLDRMWASFSSDSTATELANLRSRLWQLQTLLGKMV